MNENGYAFLAKCREALEKSLRCSLETEVRLETADKRTRVFSLATRERDIVAECRDFGWSPGGNIDSTKIEYLGKTVQNLLALPKSTGLYLILKRSVHPRGGEMLAEFFVRQSRTALENVTVLELSEDGEFRCVRGQLPHVPQVSSRA